MIKSFKFLYSWKQVSLIVLLVPLCACPQSLWKEDSRSILADKRAHAVGDILTILVQQSATATKDNSTQTARKSSIDASITSFLYPPSASGLLTKKGQLPALKTSGASSSDGGGKISNSEAITDKISVRVIDVLPNGNMVVEGTRQTAFSGESQQAVLRGSVRFEDVSANNTVYSYNLADASIKFISKGAVSDAQKKGWFNGLWDKVSPF